jgi:hypothetical protein
MKSQQQRRCDQTTRHNGITRWLRGAVIVIAAGAIAVTTAVPAQASIIWSGFTTLPGRGTCPDGNIAWNQDAQQGRVVRFTVAEKT